MPDTEIFGATHIRDGEPVRATCWYKDGDHHLVERYPIERRHFKGIIYVNEKERHALHFGDWIIEDEKGRIWIEPKGELNERYKKIEGSSP